MLVGNCIRRAWRNVLPSDRKNAGKMPALPQTRRAGKALRLSRVVVVVCFFDLVEIAGAGC